MDAQLCNIILVWKHNRINNFQAPGVVPAKTTFFYYKNKSNHTSIILWGKKILLENFPLIYCQ